MNAADQSGTRRAPAAGPGCRFVPWSVLVFVAAAVPLIVVGLERGRGQFDQKFFHEPTIRTFAAQWPRPDLSDYLSATTPGYHLALAAVARHATDSLTGLKLAGMLFTVALLWVLEWAVRRRLGARAGVAAGVGAPPSAVSPPPFPPGPLPLGGGVLVLPLVCSLYVLMPGVWLQPDNAGWLGVLAVLLIALRRRWDALSLVGGALVMLLLVWMRQSHAWAAGVLWVAAWVAKKEEGIEAARHRGIEAGVAVLSTLPALACLAWFAVLWGGLTPPSFQKQHAAGFNPAMPAFALALWGVLSVFFGAWVWGGVAALGRSWRGRAVLAGAAVVGLALAAAPATTYLYESRATGLWNLVKLTDRFGLIVAGRTSVTMLVLAPVGAVALAGWLAAVARSNGDGPRRAWIYGLGMAGFVLAQTANSNAWQRYLEPMFLMVMALMAAEAGWPTGRGRVWRWAAWGGPIALAALGAALTAYTLWNEPVVVKTW